MGRSVKTRLALLVAALVAAAGCVIPAIEPGADAPEPTAPTQPRTTGESLEGKFSYDTMDDYVNAVIPLITPFIEETWPGMPLPRVVYVPEGAVGREGCADQSGRQARYSSRSYEYCPVDGTIYVGQDMLWQFYTETGDAGPAVGLAHEYGHHVQSELGLPIGRMSSVDVENQADCIAGAWTRYTDEVLGALEYPDDIEDIEALFPLIGSAEGPGRDHGTAEERAMWFQAGFNDGIAACDL